MTLTMVKNEVSWMGLWKSLESTFRYSLDLLMEKKYFSET